MCTCATTVMTWHRNQWTTDWNLHPHIFLRPLVHEEYPNCPRSPRKKGLGDVRCMQGICEVNSHDAVEVSGDVVHVAKQSQTCYAHFTVHANPCTMTHALAFSSHYQAPTSSHLPPSPVHPLLRFHAMLSQPYPQSSPMSP